MFWGLVNLRLHNYQYFYRDIIIIIIISEEELALKERYKNLSKKDLWSIENFEIEHVAKDQELIKIR